MGPTRRPIRNAASSTSLPWDTSKAFYSSTHLKMFVSSHNFTSGHFPTPSAPSERCSTQIYRSCDIVPVLSLTIAIFFHVYSCDERTSNLHRIPFVALWNEDWPSETRAFLLLESCQCCLQLTWTWGLCIGGLSLVVPCMSRQKFWSDSMVRSLPGRFLRVLSSIHSTKSAASFQSLEGIQMVMQ